MAFDPEHDLDRLPTEPGVYLMKDAEDRVIYVGKAINLRARVRQYFGATSDTRVFVGLLDRYLADLKVIVTHTEKEALILENELIKRHQPRFNVHLKDDKAFMYLRLDEQADWPRLEAVRRPRKDRARYFGPYHSAGQLRQTMKLIERHFQLRTCDDHTFKNRSRPCLQYQIKRCLAPCVLPVDREAYMAQVRDVILFLQGRHEQLVERLEAEMYKASEEMAYERAALFRDQLRAIRGSLEPQQVASVRRVDRDIIGTFREGSALQITILQVRQGKLIGSQEFPFEEQGTANAVVLSTFLNLYYSQSTALPGEVLLPYEPEGLQSLQEHLEELKGRKIQLKIPLRGHGLRLIELAQRNAEQAFFQARREEAVRDQGLLRLKKTLRLANLPYYIECFDISLFQGGSPVGSQVAFEGGLPHRSGYRHYKIREVEGTDDFAMMREVLTRRLRRGLEQKKLPDLLVIDGGKGQLNVARAVLSDLGVEGVDVVGLAESRLLSGESDDQGGSVRSPERVFLPGRSNPVVLKPHTDEFHLLTHIRDEAHRFALTFHRKLRGQRSLSSVLDEIPGVGPQRRKALLLAFGSLLKLSEASAQQIAQVPGFGPVLAQSIYDVLHPASVPLDGASGAQGADAAREEAALEDEGALEEERGFEEDGEGPRAPLTPGPTDWGAEVDEPL